MASSRPCRVCYEITEEQRQYIEDASRNNISLRAIADHLFAQWGIKMYPANISNHLQKHVGEQADDLRELEEQLRAEMAVAPPTIAPLYASALHNLRGIRETKPNQETLIKALKAIHEITGMRIEQEALYEYARVRAARKRNLVVAASGGQSLAASESRVLDVPRVQSEAGRVLALPAVREERPVQLDSVRTTHAEDGDEG